MLRRENNSFALAENLALYSYTAEYFGTEQQIRGYVPESTTRRKSWLRERYEKELYPSKRSRIYCLRSNHILLPFLKPFFLPEKGMLYLHPCQSLRLQTPMGRTDFLMLYLAINLFNMGAESLYN